MPFTEQRDYVMKRLSSTLSAYLDDKLFILWGPGRNGKSFLTILMEYAMGELATKWSMATLRDEFNVCGANPELARGKKKRFINVTEGKNQGTLNMETFKNVTGGDRINARMLYENGGPFSIYAQIWLSVNHLPIVTDTDDGTWGRFLICKLNSKFIEFGEVNESKHIYRADIHFKQRAEGLAPYFMAILLRYYQRFLEEGLTISGDIAAETEKFRISQDVYQRYYDEKLEKGSQGVHITDLYKDCKEWARINNVKVDKSDMITWISKLDGVEHKKSLKLKFLGYDGKEKSMTTTGFTGIQLKRFRDDVEEQTETVEQEPLPEQEPEQDNEEDDEVEYVEEEEETEYVEEEVGKLSLAEEMKCMREWMGY